MGEDLMAALTEEMRQLAERFEKAVREHELYDIPEVNAEYEEAKAELLSALSWVP